MNSDRLLRLLRVRRKDHSAISPAAKASQSDRYFRRRESRVRQVSSLVDAGAQLVAHSRSCDREAERAGIPLEPVERHVVGDEAVVYLVIMTPVQEFDGWQQGVTKDLPSQPRCGRR